MKNGILTLHRADNYGAVLQAYALNTYLCHGLKKDAEIIDYYPDFIKGRYPIFGIRLSSLKDFAISVVYSVICLPFIIPKKIRFWKFRKRMNLSRSKYKYKKPQDTYDNYIVGSDQIWNLELTRYNTTYLLDFCNDEKKNSYAASIGMDKVSGKCEDYFKRFLNCFNNISVREMQAREYLENILEDKKVYQCIDPVFLLNKDTWDKLAGKPIMKKPYIFIYSFNSEKPLYDIANEIAYSRECKIVSVTFGRNRKIYGVKAYASWGPIEFLNVLRHSEMVLTDSFHGCAFSIIFKKNFYVYPYKGTNSRMESLLGICGLKNRIIGNEDFCKEDIDYSQTDKKLEAAISGSKDYLRSIVR